MKNYILVLIAAILINVANGVNYEEEDVYDDDNVFQERSNREPQEENLERPNYDIKDAPYLFQKFVNDYNKKYETEEESKQRYEYFVMNLKEIIANNKAGGSSVSDINMFADFTDDELAKLG